MNPKPGLSFLSAVGSSGNPYSLMVSNPRLVAWLGSEWRPPAAILGAARP